MRRAFNDSGVDTSGNTSGKLPDDDAGLNIGPKKDGPPRDKGGPLEFETLEREEGRHGDSSGLMSELAGRLPGQRRVELDDDKLGEAASNWPALKPEETPRKGAMSYTTSLGWLMALTILFVLGSLVGANQSDNILRAMAEQTKALKVKIAEESWARLRDTAREPHANFKSVLDNFHQNLVEMGMRIEDIGLKPNDVRDLSYYHHAVVTKHSKVCNPAVENIPTVQEIAVEEISSEVSDLRGGGPMKPKDEPVAPAPDGPKGTKPEKRPSGQDPLDGLL